MRPAGVAKGATALVLLAVLAGPADVSPELRASSERQPKPHPGASASPSDEQFDEEVVGDSPLGLDPDELGGEPVDVSRVADQVSQIRGLPIDEDIDAYRLSKREWIEMFQMFPSFGTDVEARVLTVLKVIPKKFPLETKLPRFM